MWIKSARWHLGTPVDALAAVLGQPSAGAFDPWAIDLYAARQTTSPDVDRAHLSAPAIDDKGPTAMVPVGPWRYAEQVTATICACVAEPLHFHWLHVRE